MISLNDEAKIAGLNRPALVLLGAERRADLLGKELCGDVVSPASQEYVELALGKAQKGEPQKGLEAQLEAKGGSLPTSLDIRPRIAVGDAIPGTVVTINTPPGSSEPDILGMFDKMATQLSVHIHLHCTQSMLWLLSKM